ncbi:hypothetical protein NUM3379_04490 [Kineococcus sp. NUM-3379]
MTLPPQPPAGGADDPAATRDHIPAPMDRRARARALDSALVAVPVLAVVGLLLLWGRASRDELTGQEGVVPTILLMLFALFVAPVLAVAFEVATTAVGGSPGKRWQGLAVVLAGTDEPPGWAPALTRCLVLLAGVLLPVAGWVLLALSPRLDASGEGRGWHDLAAGTQVVDTR